MRTRQCDRRSNRWNKLSIGKAKREKEAQGYIQKSIASKITLKESGDKSRQNKRQLETGSCNKQLNTINNFYKSDIFAKTSIENTGKERIGSASKNNQSDSSNSYVNFIEKNKNLSRVAEINRRRFSGAFDHLNIFPVEMSDKERLVKLKSFKRKASTARAGSRNEFKNFSSFNNRSKTPAAIDSYRNYSVNERNRHYPTNSNALVAKLNTNEIYEKLVSSTQKSQSLINVYPPEFK